MGTVFTYLVVAAAAYLCGAVPYGYLIGKFYGKDVRKLGSGNIGATNVTRVIGSKAGKFCFFLDAFKGFLPVFLVGMLLGNADGGAAQLLALLCTVCGHVFSCFLGFKGGKGVSTAAGGVLALAPLAFAIAMLSWGIFFYLWGYVSLASILAAVVLSAAATVLSVFQIEWTPLTILIGIYFLTLGVILKHKSNIKRLLNGTENRFERRKKGEK